MQSHRYLPMPWERCSSNFLGRWEMQNDFTQALLNYSAERDDCIGRPERWGNPPPLVVSTPLHEEMKGLAHETWAGAVHPIWYFLVGGPGNGKSEAVGAYVRALNASAAGAGR